MCRAFMWSNDGQGRDRVQSETKLCDTDKEQCEVGDRTVGEQQQSGAISLPAHPIAQEPERITGGQSTRKKRQS